MTTHRVKIDMLKTIVNGTIAYLDTPLEIGEAASPDPAFVFT